MSEPTCGVPPSADDPDSQASAALDAPGASGTVIEPITRSDGAPSSSKPSILTAAPVRATRTVIECVGSASATADSMSDANSRRNSSGSMRTRSRAISMSMIRAARSGSTSSSATRSCSNRSAVFSSSDTVRSQLGFGDRSPVSRPCTARYRAPSRAGPVFGTIPRLNEYDDIIVGGGSAGIALATRLTEDEARQVLLIEAGPDHPGIADADRLDDQMRFAATLTDWAVDAAYVDGGDALNYPQGRTMGGGSAVNGAFAVRGVRDDYERW